ncbi:MAG: DUF2225 domain-containing protein [Bacteroidetes bacterium]|nr:DUF2225 domain-containing protein [Bacteroidota bacterium]
MESIPGYAEEELDSYIALLFNFMYVLVELKTEEFFIVIKKIRTLGDNKKFASHSKMRTQIFMHSYLCELGFYYETGKFEQGAKLIAEVEDGLKKYKAQTTEYEKITLYYLIATIYIRTKEYKKALSWVNRVLDMNNVLNNVQPMARVLNILIHYKLGNKEILEHLIRSSERFLKKSERNYQLEIIVLKNIKKLMWVVSKDKLVASFKNLRSELLILLEDPYEKNALAYFDLVSWIDVELKEFSPA